MRFASGPKRRVNRRFSFGHLNLISSGTTTALMNTPKSVIELAKKSGAKMVDIKFVDTFGTWQHFSCPIRELTAEIFTEGLGFDGSSIRGWKSIEASDMLAMPDTATAFIDPFMIEEGPRLSPERGCVHGRLSR